MSKLATKILVIEIIQNKELYQSNIRNNNKY